MPARLRNIKRALAQRGIQVIEPNGGSHWKATDGRVSYTIPCHGGLKGEVTDVYIRGLCRAFALEFEDFRREL